MLRALAVLFTFSLLSLSPLLGSPAPPSLLFQDQQQDQPQYQQQDQGPAYENFSPEQLDNLLSPIALYPDPLLAQFFVAATFPDQVEEAARYVRANGDNGVDDQNWDVSVRAVAHYPTVIGMMADKIDWTTSIGQAYVNQSTDVASSVQRLRHMARAAGNLQSSQQQEVLEQDNYIAINPYQPQYIYVPVYDPAIIYYRRPYYGPAITFGVGYPIGVWLNLGFRWGYGGGWGGVYYTAWRPGGWGAGCWNCGWIGRSRVNVNINNNIYINNRYTNINVNRNVVNRTVNVNNINHYNSVHKNVNYNNVEVNNNRATRVNNVNNGRPGNSQGNNGYNGRQNGNNSSGNRPGNGQGNNGRANTQPAGNDRPAPTNKIIDSNIDRKNPQLDQYRGRDNSTRNDRPPTAQQRPTPTPSQPAQNRPNNQSQPSRPQGQQPQTRPAPQPQMTRPTPHTFNPNEANFDPRTSSQRGQSSRQQAAQPRPAAPPPRPAAQQQQPKAQSRPPQAPAQQRGGQKGKP
jgi:hypothetical protein